MLSELYPNKISCMTFAGLRRKGTKKQKWTNIYLVQKFIKLFYDWEVNTSHYFFSLILSLNDLLWEPRGFQHLHTLEPPRWLQPPTVLRPDPETVKLKSLVPLLPYLTR